MSFKKCRIVSYQPSKNGIIGKRGAIRYGVTDKIEKVEEKLIDKDGRDYCEEEICPASCAQLRQRRKKDEEDKFVWIYLESYCLSKNRPSRCMNSVLTKYDPPKK